MKKIIEAIQAHADASKRDMKHDDFMRGMHMGLLLALAEIERGMPKDRREPPCFNPVDDGRDPLEGNHG